jgi:hypothetical protein
VAMPDRRLAAQSVKNGCIVTSVGLKAGASTVKVSRRLRTSSSWQTAFSSAVNLSIGTFGTPLTSPRRSEYPARTGVALGRGDGECTDFPSLDLFPGGREVIASDPDLAADEILHLLVRRAVSHGSISPQRWWLERLPCGVRLIWIGLNPGDELRGGFLPGRRDALQASWAE